MPDIADNILIEDARSMVSDIIFDVTGILPEDLEGFDPIHQELRLNDGEIETIQECLSEITGAKIDLSSRPLALDHVFQQVFDALRKQTHVERSVMLTLFSE